MVSMTDPDPRAAFAAMTKALITDFRANGGQVTSGPLAGRLVLLLICLLYTSDAADE